MTKKTTDNAITRPKPPFWLRILPASLRCRIEHRLGLRQAVVNTGWLFGDKILRMSVGLVILLALARYLGPEQFGTLNYALAFVSLFAPIASLGLAGIVVRDLVAKPNANNTTLGTAFILHIIGGLAAACLAALVVAFARPDDFVVKLMVVILGAAMVFKAADVIKYWFESQVQSKFTVWVENGVFLVFSGVTLLLIVEQASLLVFAWVILAEAAVVSAGLIGVYVWKCGSLSGWKITWARTRELLADSWPLILSGLAVMTYMRVDQIMIGHMLGDEAVGIYSAAVRISEVWYFIPMAIVASVFPTITKARNQSKSVYLGQLQQLYNILALIALPVAVLVFLFSDWIALLFFGTAYQASGTILAIHIWSGIFVFLGVASSRWLLLENLQRHVLYRSLLGMAVNIALNFVLIPIWGGVGAAIATLIAYAISVFSIYLASDTRIGAVMMWRSLISLGLNRAHVKA